MTPSISQYERPRPLCGHPELFMGMVWDAAHQRLVLAEKPPAAEMVGPCEHNMSCPVCGFGWGQAPDPCAASQYERRP